MADEQTRRLKVQAGHHSARGPRHSNQDCAGHAEAAALARQRGPVFVIADGLGGHQGGGIASQLAVAGFLEAIQEAPHTLGVRRAAGGALNALNAWLHAQGRADPALAHAATTLTALLLNGRSLHILHVGDTRAYRLRDGQLQLLTEDHVHPGAERQHQLYRAVGLEATLRTDYAAHSLRVHDRLLLCTDGVHAALKQAVLARLLGQRSSPDEDARRLVEAALAAGSQDNATAIVIDVLAVPEADVDELSAHLAALPNLVPPALGELVDDFRITRLIARGRASQLLEADDLPNSRRVALKFPTREAGNDAAARASFVRELWVSTRVYSPYLSRAFELQPQRQTRLYAVLPLIEGTTLEARLMLSPRLALNEGVRIALQLARALLALHRSGVVHRDVKPDNIMLRSDGSLLLLDLGVARLPELEPEPAVDIPGTPSFMAPELLAGEHAGDALSDQFAFGATLYRALTRHYPYGEIEPFMHPRFGSPIPLTRHRPDLPAWLGHVIERCLAVTPAARYGDLLEFIHEMESGQAQGAHPARLHRPLYERSPLRFWQVVSALLLLALLLALHQRS